MEDNVIYQIKNLDVAIIKKMCSISKENKVCVKPTPLQTKILKYILDSKGKEVYQRDLEEVLKVSRATVSEALLAMEKSDIISRVTSTKDARIKQIVLTKKSKKIYNEMENSFKKLNEKIIQNIPEDEVESFLVTLKKMINNMEEE